MDKQLKDAIRSLFEEILGDYEQAEEAAISEYSGRTLESDLRELQEKVADYRMRLENLLN